MRTEPLFENLGCRLSVDNNNELDHMRASDVFNLLHETKLIYICGAQISLDAFIQVSSRLCSEFRADPSAHGNRGLVSADRTTYEAVRGNAVVPPHGELYSLPNPPDLLFLHCEQPAEVGGETTFYDGQSMATALKPTVRQRLLDNPLVYRHFWQREQWSHVCKTDDLATALDLIAAFDGVRLLDVTGERITFEYQTSAFSDERGSVLVNGVVNILSRAKQGINTVTFAAGEPIDAEVTTELERVAHAMEHSIALQAGEFVIVDNHRVMHGRRAFEGQRRVAARFGRRIQDVK